VVEAAFASAADERRGVSIRRGAPVAGVRTGAEALPGVPHVVGVQLTDGEVLAADLVIDATGRRTKLPDWLAAAGARPPLVESEDSGFVYHTRYFTGPELPFLFGPPLVPLGSISLLTLAGDNDTWSVTVWGASADPALKALKRPETWTRVVQACPLQAHWLDGEPLGGIATMAGIMDRHRRYVVDGRPVATGVVPVGDAWACTNPSAGRGLSVGLVHAQLLRRAVAGGLDDPVDLVDRFDEATEAIVTPFFRNQRVADRARIAEMDASRAGREPPPPDPEMAALRAAMVQDPDVFRANMEVVGCLATVQDVLARPLVRTRMDELAGQVPEPFPGPDRAQLVDLLA
jgi:flavin-dependent dehydrogenase